MKTLLTSSAAALLLSTGLAAAEPFEFEKYYAHGELDPSFAITNYTRPDDWVARDVEISLHEFNRGNPEIRGYRELDEWMSEVEISAEDEPTSLEVFTQGNPEYPESGV